MKASLAAILVGLGIAIIAIGYRRADSFEGQIDAAAAEVANQWDGKVRQPDHVWFYVWGGVLIASGGVVFFRKKPV